MGDGSGAPAAALLGEDSRFVVSGQFHGSISPCSRLPAAGSAILRLSWTRKPSCSGAPEFWGSRRACSSVASRWTRSRPAYRSGAPSWILRFTCCPPRRAGNRSRVVATALDCRRRVRPARHGVCRDGQVSIRLGRCDIRPADGDRAAQFLELARQCHSTAG